MLFLSGGDNFMSNVLNPNHCASTKLNFYTKKKSTLDTVHVSNDQQHCQACR